MKSRVNRIERRMYKAPGNQKGTMTILIYADEDVLCQRKPIRKETRETNSRGNVFIHLHEQDMRL